MRMEKNRPSAALHFYRVSGIGHKATYEIWITEPVKLATIEKVNSGVLLTEDKHEFANLREAAIHVLEQNSKEELIPDLLQTKTSKERVYKVEGIEIAKAGKWLEFCTLKNINPDNKTAIVKTHWLKESELEEIKLRKPA